MSKISAYDDEGRVFWCDQRKGINPGRIGSDTFGCSHPALASVPQGTCNRLFDSDGFKLCTDASLPGMAVAGGAAGATAGGTFADDWYPFIAAGAGVVGAAGLPAYNAATNRESCTAVDTLEDTGYVADGDYCPIPVYLQNNPTKENANKFGISCIDNDGTERSPVSSCWTMGFDYFRNNVVLGYEGGKIDENLENDEGNTMNDCETKWSMGGTGEDGEREVPYTLCKKSGGPMFPWQSNCVPETDGKTCSFDENLVTNLDSQGLSDLYQWQNTSNNNDTYVDCIYGTGVDGDATNFDPRCPRDTQPTCPELNRRAYDFTDSDNVIYCGKKSSGVKCSNDSDKVDSNILGDDGKYLEKCPCGFTGHIMEDPDDDGCLGLDAYGYGLPCNYRVCYRT